MPERDWVQSIALGALAGLVIAGVGWAILETGFYLGQTYGEQQANSDTYARSAAEDIESLCLGGEPTSVASCIRQVTEATNEHERAQRDLVAQQRMQLWALWLLGVSGFGTAIAGYGLVLLRRTWFEAKAATNAAQDAVAVTRDLGQRQVRAYVSILGANVFDCGIGKQPKIVITIKNTGQSPAKNLKIRSVFAHGTDASLRPKLKLDSRAPPVALELGAGLELNHGGEITSIMTEPWLRKIASGKEQFLAAGFITYKTVFGETRRVTFRFHSGSGDIRDNRVILYVATRHNHSN